MGSKKHHIISVKPRPKAAALRLMLTPREREDIAHWREVTGATNDMAAIQGVLEAWETHKKIKKLRLYLAGLAIRQRRKRRFK